MKIFHLSDLHIGKQLNGYSLKENQEAVLRQIVCASREQRPDAVLICGDIYDKTVPSGEALRIFSDFLEDLGNISPAIPVLIIAGNHDSPERLKFASSFLEKHKIFISVFPPQRQDEYLKKVTLKDEYGPVNFYMLPFLKPGFVRHLFEEEKSRNFGYEEAVRAVLEREKIDCSERNVLLSHQFYISQGKKPEICDSELAVAVAGGLDSIDIQALEKFDYAALGHIHGCQAVGREHIRYCGSPFKYSVSEERHQKAILSVTLSNKGEPVLTERIPLYGLQDVRKEEGTLEQVLGRASEANRHDFVSITLTDEKELYNFREKLEEVYDHILEIKLDSRHAGKLLEDEEEDIRYDSPMEAFRDFYQAVRRCPVSSEEEHIMEQVILQAETEVGGQ